MRKLINTTIIIFLILIVLNVVSRIRDGSVSNEESILLNEQSCVDRGFEKITIHVDGRERSVLWKGPEKWTKGAVIAMHGGGGDYTQWCYESLRLVKPQVDFSDLAVERGFAVFLLESTNDVVTDSGGLVCGKRWDATLVEGRTDNVDLPFIEQVITEIVPSKRPVGSSINTFLTGESTGGYMAILTATHFDNLITAFAPVASGDPYGTYFDCDPSLSLRESAKGAGFDRETNKQITEAGACLPNAHFRDRSLETVSSNQKIPFKMFHSVDDGIVDISCQKKAEAMLVQQGYINDGAYVLLSQSSRNVWSHLWQAEYNIPVLDFFEKIGNELMK
ncbi:hypothetical protein KC730_03145 [Candidatus Kaiserbacteria bacterium]|nr:hypothetical protein [Candidatus Kaiserbacteria bacterium]